MKKNLVILYAHLLSLSLFTTHRLGGLAFTPDMSSMMAEMSKNLFQNDAEAADFMSFIEEQGGIENIARTVLPQLEEQGMLPPSLLNNSFNPSNFGTETPPEKATKKPKETEEDLGKKLNKKTLFLTPPRKKDAEKVVITQSIEAAFHYYIKAFVHYLRKTHLAVKAYKLGIDTKELTHLLLATATIEPDLITMLSFHKHSSNGEEQNPYLKEFFQKPYDKTRKQLLNALSKLKKIHNRISSLKQSSEEEFGEYDPTTNTFKKTPIVQEHDAIKEELRELYGKNLKGIAGKLQKIIKNPEILKTIEALQKKHHERGSSSSYYDDSYASSSDWGSGWSGGGSYSHANSYGDDFGGYGGDGYSGGSYYSPSSSSSYYGRNYGSYGDYGSSSDFSDTPSARYGSYARPLRNGESTDNESGENEAYASASEENQERGKSDERTKTNTVIRSEQELKNEVILISTTLEKALVTESPDQEKTTLVVNLLEKNYLSTLEKTLKEIARVKTKSLNTPSQAPLTPFQKAIDLMIPHLFFLIDYDLSKAEEILKRPPHQEIINEELRAARFCIPLIVRGAYTQQASIEIKKALQKREQDEIATLEGIAEGFAKRFSSKSLQQIIAVSTTLLQPPSSVLYPELLDEHRDEVLSDFEKHVARSVKVLLQLQTATYQRFIAKNSKKSLWDNIRTLLQKTEDETITDEEITACTSLLSSAREKEKFTHHAKTQGNRAALVEYLNNQITKIDEQCELCQNFMLMIKQSRIIETAQKLRQRAELREATNVKA